VTSLAKRQQCQQFTELKCAKTVVVAVQYKLYAANAICIYIFTANQLDLTYGVYNKWNNIT